MSNLNTRKLDVKCLYRDNNGKRHRLDGPAFESPYGVNEWWVSDLHCTTWHEFQLHSKVSDEELNMLILKYGSIS